ncbi:MAG: DEAD/DEAH box helicase [Clostridia bacterium]|nr:DEAD/DEAH box helicase [Deltaproteobacteria bacterium]
MSFDQFDLHPTVLKAVLDAGYTTPTPIQVAAIDHIIDGRDVLGCAQTGTGKTAAFALPILDYLLREKPAHGPRCLVLAPTRELATQISESFETYGARKIKTAVLIGGVGQGRQVDALRAGADVIIAAPGRLLDLMEQRLVDLRDIDILVLDEADRMLDMGFIQPLRRIVKVLPEKRQTLLFSATMPKEIRELAEDFLYDPVSIAVTPVASTAAAITEEVYHVHQKDKPELLHNLFVSQQMGRAIVFTRTKHGADRLSRRLEKVGVRSSVIHGNKSQGARVRALEAFRDGSIRMLIATDVAARGIDVDGVSHVINYDLPNEPESYVHRIGRTGRAGATGTAIAFCDVSERPYLKQIEKLTCSSLKVAQV